MSLEKRLKKASSFSSYIIYELMGRNILKRLKGYRRDEYLILVRKKKA